MAAREIPVYLFTGFLDAGKSTFIQSTLEDKRFNSGEKTLLIRCEDGETEYDFSSFSGENVFLRTMEEEEEFNEAALQAAAEETRCERVIIEYNGMWPMQTLYDNIPEGWMVVQEICFAESSSFTVYNANMRNLVYDKIQTCDVIVFNRCSDSSDLDSLHKIVRTANRRCNIFYEYPDGRSVMDEKVDPLPFDKNASVIAVEDRDFAYFFSDLMENTGDYDGKTVQFKALFPQSTKQMPDSVFVAGRMLMNCCAADTQFAGLACYRGSVEKPKPGSWFVIKGKIRLQRNRMFGEKTPVLDVMSVTPAVEPEDPVATFY